VGLEIFNHENTRKSTNVGDTAGSFLAPPSSSAAKLSFAALHSLNLGGDCAAAMGPSRVFLGALPGSRNNLR
jgi:hypothetical protein